MCVHASWVLAFQHSPPLLRLPQQSSAKGGLLLGSENVPNLAGQVKCRATEHCDALYLCKA